MIVCPNCSKENQDHYKFCLGCGSDLPRSSEEQKKPLSTATPPAGIAAASIPEPAQVLEPAAATPATAQPAVSSSSAEGSGTIGSAVGAVGAAAVAGAAAVSSSAVASLPTDMPEDARRQFAPETVEQVETPAEIPPEPEPEPAATPDICNKCGAAIQPGFAFCGACGTPVAGAQPVSSPVSSFATDSARLVLIQPDGTEGGTVEIPTTEVAVGRDAGGFFEVDAYLSPRHAIFKSNGKSVTVKDIDSLNGIFIKTIPNEPQEIHSGDIIRLGQELILFEAVDRGTTTPDGTEKMGSPIEGLWGRISLIVGNNRLGNAFPAGGEGVILGRERGNIIFPEDGYVSGIHLRISTDGDKFFATDLGSSNGSFIKIKGQATLNKGDFLLMGAQLFRIDI